jgi:hypothetical protein
MKIGLRYDNLCKIMFECRWNLCVMCSYFESCYAAAAAAAAALPYNLYVLSGKVV